MADTRSKYIPPDRASASYLGKEEGRGKNVGSSDDRREQSVYRANAFRGHRRGRREGGEKKAWSRRDTMDRWFDVLFTQIGREGGISRSKFSWFVEDAMFPTTLSIDFDLFLVSIV